MKEVKDKLLGQDYGAADSVTVHLGSESPGGPLTLETWSALVFSNHQLKPYPEVMQSAADLRPTYFRYIMALTVIFGAAFNLYAIINNFVSLDSYKIFDDGDLVSTEHARIFVFGCELGGALAMTLYLFGFLFHRFFCQNDDALKNRKGETALTISKQIQNIGLFSLVKGAADIKSYVSTEIEDWRIVSGKPISGMAKCMQFSFWAVVRFLWISLSVLAFLMKLTQISFVGEKPLKDYEQTDWIAFLGFVNNMISLYSPPRIALDAVWRFIFAGVDSTYTSEEDNLQREFMECMAYNICENKNFFDGHSILLTLSTADIQRFLLKDAGKLKFVGEVSDDI